jgi:predicted phosphoribosyltransferase
MSRRLRNRSQAGRLLAEQLSAYKRFPDVMVLALPRGGMPVAFEIARALGAALDVFLVRKLGIPGFPQMAMGAVASGGARYVDRELTAALRIPGAEVEKVVAREEAELEQCEQTYRAGRAPLDLEGRTVILVDDGAATGASMSMVIAALRRMKPGRIVVAAPLVPVATFEELRLCADDVVCLLKPEGFRPVSSFYEEFEQVSDDQVCRLLETASQPAAPLAA